MSQRRPTIPPDPETSRRENERQYRVLNQMLTAHSTLRDRFARRSKALRICLFCSAIAVSGFAFADEKLFQHVGMTPEAVKLAVGVTSLFVLALSVVELLVGWERTAALHEEATRRLSALKLRYRQAHTKYGGKNVRVNEGLTKEWGRLNENLPSINDQQFLRLKHRHQIKRQLSELAEQNRQVPYLFLVLYFYASGIWRTIKGGLHRPPEDGKSPSTPAVLIDPPTPGSNESSTHDASHSETGKG